MLKKRTRTAVARRYEPRTEIDVFGHRAKTIQAPLLVTNRVGYSWMYKCEGGCVGYSKHGEVQVKANREGKEEILLHDLEVQPLLP